MVTFITEFCILLSNRLCYKINYQCRVKNAVSVDRAQTRIVSHPTNPVKPHEKMSLASIGQEN